MRDKALKTKIIILFLGTILAMSILIGILLFAVSLRLHQEKAGDNIASINAMLGSNVTNLKREIEGISVRSALNKPIKTLLTASNDHPGEAISRHADLGTINQAILFIENERLTKNHVRSISLYNRHYQEIVTLGEYDTKNHYTAAFDTYTTQKLSLAESAVYYQMFTGIGADQTISRAVIEIYSPLFDLNELAIIGYLRITYSPAALFSNYNSNTSPEILTFLKHGENGFIYHPRLESYLPYWDDFSNAGITGQSGSLMINNNNYLVSTAATSIENMQLIIAYPFSDIIRDTLKLYIQIMILIIVILAILFILFNRALRHILSPMQELTRLVSTASADNHFSAEALAHFSDVHPADDEVSRLGQSFQKMTEKVNSSIEELAASYQQRQELELRLLQSQINPHFLYNSIDSICGLACLKQYDDIFSMAKNLGSFYKLSLRKGAIYTTVEDEFQHVDSYLQIEQLRHNHSFLYTLKCAPECRQLRVIKILLQPIVENAVIHGIRGYQKPGYLHITCSCEDGFIVFQIFNNGFSFKPELADFINRGFPGESEQLGFGIRNVYQRLKLYYKNKASLHYDVTDGTLVTIQIPWEDCDGSIN